MSPAATYGMQKKLSCSYEDAVPKVKEALAKQGFGILTEIDVKATFKKKLDVDFNKYVILGACNPAIAHQTLQAETEIGLFLPCNVIVYENADKETVVSAVDPVKMLETVGNPGLTASAESVKGLLEKTLKSL